MSSPQHPIDGAVDDEHSRAMAKMHAEREHFWWHLFPERIALVAFAVVVVCIIVGWF